jgi:hypothetical protein
MSGKSRIEDMVKAHPITFCYLAVVGSLNLIINLSLLWLEALS